MFYKKTEEYDFRVPREYKAYLAFRERLKDMGIKFVDQHHSMSCTVTITTRGNFDVDDKCDIWNLVKEEK